MGQCYGQLSLEERVEIYRLHAGGRSQNEIASALDRAPSSGRSKSCHSPPELSLVNSRQTPKGDTQNHQLRQRKTSSPNIIGFTKHIGVQTFFCDPHSPWQKGGVENSIGRLRRSLPRKPDLNFITAAALKRHVQRLNDHPTEMPGLQDTRRGILQTQINRCTSNVTSIEPKDKV